MTTWRGFIVESKAYVGYQSGSKLRFWFRFPAAMLRFYWYKLRGAVMIWAAKRSL